MTTTTIDIARLDGGHINLTAQQLDDLDSRIAGRLLRAGDDGWDDALLVWNGMTAKVPALVLQPASPTTWPWRLGSPATMGCFSASRVAGTTSPGLRSPDAA